MIDRKMKFAWAELVLAGLAVVGLSTSSPEPILLESNNLKIVFSTWYSNADPLSRTFQIDALQENILSLKRQALERQ